MREARHFSWASTLVLGQSGRRGRLRPLRRAPADLAAAPGARPGLRERLRLLPDDGQPGSRRRAEPRRPRPLHRSWRHRRRVAGRRRPCLTSFFRGDLRRASRHRPPLPRFAGRQARRPGARGLPRSRTNWCPPSPASPAPPSPCSGEVDAGRSLLIGAEARADRAADSPMAPTPRHGPRRCRPWPGSPRRRRGVPQRSIAEIRHLAVKPRHDSSTAGLQHPGRHGRRALRSHRATPSTCARCSRVWRATGRARLDAVLPVRGRRCPPPGRRPRGRARNVAADVLDLARTDRRPLLDVAIIRLRGEVRLDAATRAALSDLLRAAALAAQQGARLFELQAGLALLPRDGRRRQPSRSSSDLVRVVPRPTCDVRRELDEARRLLAEHGRG